MLAPSAIKSKIDQACIKRLFEMYTEIPKIIRFCLVEAETIEDKVGIEGPVYMEVGWVTRLAT